MTKVKVSGHFFFLPKNSIRHHHGDDGVECSFLHHWINKAFNYQKGPRKSDKMYIPVSPRKLTYNTLTMMANRCFKLYITKIHNIHLVPRKGTDGPTHTNHTPTPSSVGVPTGLSAGLEHTSHGAVFSYCHSNSGVQIRRQVPGQSQAEVPETQ